MKVEAGKLVMFTELYVFFCFQYLLRQGREAVVVAHELDVVSTEYSEESPTQAGDMVKGINHLHNLSHKWCFAVSKTSCWNGVKVHLNDFDIYLTFA